MRLIQTIQQREALVCIIPLYRCRPPVFHCWLGKAHCEHFLFHYTADSEEKTPMERSYRFIHELKCETSLTGSRYESAHHFHVGLAIKGLCKYGHHKHIDEERDEESDGGLDEVVLVGLLHLLLVCSIYVS